jgi:mRNA degradation ribonuclease J1/J2
MWPGYLRNPSGERLKAFLKGQAIPLVIQHASGHATAVDLARLAQALAPTCVVPIHTATPEAFAATVANVGLRAVAYLGIPRVRLVRRLAGLGPNRVRASR